MLQSVNPATEETIATYPFMDDTEIGKVLTHLNEEQRSWKLKTYEERSKVLVEAADLLRSRTDEYAQIMTFEMGKPLAQGRSELEKCAWVCEYFAENAESFLADETVETDAALSYVTYQPLGTVFAIMPWNFPFWQLFRFAAPALMAGNAVALKHAPTVTGCAMAIEELFADIFGEDENLVRTLRVSEEQASEVIADRSVQAVTFTGSTGGGRAVASQAAKALKKTVLELGGSDPYIVLEDADLEKALGACVTSRFQNSGQSCIAAKRLIVVDEIYDAFKAKLEQRISSLVMGDPEQEETDIGPMAREDLRDELHRQVRESVDAGAILEQGGVLPDRPGWFYPPTLLTGVTEAMPAFREELFGPVAVLIRAEDQDHAVALANNTNYGLGAAIFSEDIERAELIAAELLEAGAVAVNGFVKSDPRLPFGGIKQSGYGRELARQGIREFTNTKTVTIT